MAWTKLNESRSQANDPKIERAIKLRATGMQLKDIAAVLEVRPSTVGRWMQEQGVARRRGKHPSPEPTRGPSTEDLLDQYLFGGNRDALTKLVGRR